jgi:hypothetical protein
MSRNIWGKNPYCLGNGNNFYFQWIYKTKKKPLKAFSQLGIECVNHAVPVNFIVDVEFSFRVEIEMLNGWNWMIRQWIGSKSGIDIFNLDCLKHIYTGMHTELQRK